MLYLPSIIFLSFLKGVIGLMWIGIILFVKVYDNSRSFFCNIIVTFIRNMRGFCFRECFPTFRSSINKRLQSSSLNSGWKRSIFNTIFCIFFFAIYKVTMKVFNVDLWDPLVMKFLENISKLCLKWFFSIDYFSWEERFSKPSKETISLIS